MDVQIRPSLFYGTAVAACLGLTLGLALHGPWQSKAGGPQILFASAAAAELARAPSDADIIEASAPAEQPAYADMSLADTGQLPADPLPVTRLSRSGGSALPAHADVERVSTDSVDVAALDGEPSEFRREIAIADPEPRPAPHTLTSVSYNAYGPAY